MGRKRQNKKKNKQRIVQPSHRQQYQEVQDELIALEAVFADDITLHHDRHGFDLHVVPYPSKVEVNHVSVRLTVRCGDSYPREAPELSLEAEGCREDHDVDELLQQLNQLAMDMSKTRDVFMFSLIDLCQETLLNWNADIVAQQPEHVPQNMESSQNVMLD